MAHNTTIKRSKFFLPKTVHAAATSSAIKQPKTIQKNIKIC